MKELKIKLELLKLKTINFQQKIVLAIIVDQSVPSMSIGCQLTCGEIGKLIGLSRNKVSDIFWELEELNLITTKVIDRSRETKITAQFKRLMNKDKELLND